METRSRKFFISDQSASELTCDIARAFAAAGDDVCIVSGRELPALAGTPIRTAHVCAYERSSFPRRIATWLAGTWGIFRVFRKNPDAELLIISNPPPAPILPLFLENKFSLLLWDVWPDALVHTRTLSPRHPIVRFWEFLNRRAFRRAEKIFAIGESQADALARYAPREKIVVIPVWANTEFLKPLPKSENLFLREHDLTGKFVVMYSGNIGNTHPVEKLVDIAAELREHTDIAFVIVGDGGKRETVRRRIEETGVKNVSLLPFEPRERLPHSLAAPDIGVVTLEEAASQVSVPSKTYSMLATGTPLLCLAGAQSELAALVHKFGVGEIFAPADTKAAAAWILSLKNDAQAHAAMRKRTRETSLLFTPKNAEKYVAALRGKTVPLDKGERARACAGRESTETVSPADSAQIRSPQDAGVHAGKGEKIS